MVNIGVLALQGSFREHLEELSRLDGVRGLEVKYPGELNEIDGLILPGGESTTIGKLLAEFGLSCGITMKARTGMPVWGTCAGLILLARKIAGEDAVYLGLMDIAVKRNAFGGQLESFRTHLSIPGISDKEVEAVFIRAPWIDRVYGNAEIMAELDGKIVAARQGNLLATSFHPEITHDLAFHEYFAGMVRDYIANRVSQANNFNR